MLKSIVFSLGLAAPLFPSLVLGQGVGDEGMDIAAPVSVPLPPEPVPVAAASTMAPPDALSPSLAPAPDTAQQNAETIRLHARSGFTPRQPRVGDTVEYAIEIRWRETRIPVLVLAPDSVDFTGLKYLDQGTRHEKSVQNGQVENRTVFAYTLLAQAPGPAKAAALKVRYTTGLSGREEAVYAPAGHVEIAPARFAFLKSGWFQILLGLLAAGGLLVGGFAVWRRSSRQNEKKKSAAANPQQALADEVRALKLRIGHGESREILLAMEKISLRHLVAALNADASLARFDALLDLWVKAHPEDLDRAADWEKLRELFRQARYAGGHKEPHELQDGWRAMRRCLDLSDEP